MENLIITAYEFSVSLIPFLIIMILFQYQHKKQGIFIPKLYCATTVIFEVYMIAVFHFTGVGTLYDILMNKMQFTKEYVNFIPFSRDIDVIAYLQNILLFMPFGFLMPFICNKKAGFTCILYTGFGFSLLIEISQLLNSRRTDIDDLILNTLGAVTGFILYSLFTKIIKSKSNYQSFSYIELLILIAVTFIGRFLLFNEISIAKLIYKF